MHVSLDVPKSGFSSGLEKEKVNPVYTCPSPGCTLVRDNELNKHLVDLNLADT